MPPGGQHQSQNPLHFHSAHWRANKISGNPRPHTQLCQDLPLSTNDLTPALGSLGPAARLQYLALAASSLTLTSGPGFTLLAH